MPISAAAAATYESIANINRVIAAEAVPLADLQAHETTLTTASTTISGLASRLSALGAAAEALSDPTGVMAMSATSSDAGVFAGITQSGVLGPTGAFTVSVDQIAKEHRIESYAKNTAIDALNMSGTLEMRVGAATANLDIVATDSLSDIATKISSSGLRMAASITFDGEGYKLAIRGLDTGAANTVSFTQIGNGPSAGTHSALTLGLWRPSNTTQGPQDALFSVNGVAQSSASNQVIGAIPGVTLALAAPTASATVTVSSEAVLNTNLANFVAAYNDVVTSGHAAVGYGGQPAAVALLAGDTSVLSSLAQVSDLLVTPVLGTMGLYQTLDSIGLESDADGLLHLNSPKLAAAIADDQLGVARIFAGYDGSAVLGSMVSFRETIARLSGNSNSLLRVRLDGLTTQTQAIQQNEQMIEHRLGTYRNILHDLLETLAQQLAAPP